MAARANFIALSGLTDADHFSDEFFLHKLKTKFLPLAEYFLCLKSIHNKSKHLRTRI